jgi:hypothetical protein
MSAEIIAAIVAFLGLGAAIQGFFLVPLVWKLAGIAIGAMVCVGIAATRLASWAKPELSAGFRQEDSQRSWAQIATSSAVLLVICILFAVIAGVVVWFNTLNVEVLASQDTRTEFWIRGAQQGTDRLSIHLPAPSHKKCAPIDAPAGGRLRADLTVVDWNTASPQLQLSNFFYPQVVGVRCSLGIDLNRIVIRVEPPTAEVFFPDRRFVYNASIAALGGALWIVALFGFWFRSR